LKLNGTFQILAYIDYVITLGGSVLTVKENAEDLVVAAKGIRLEVNGDKTKYMVKSRDKNAERNHNMKTDNSSIERVEGLQNWGTMLADRNSFRNKLRKG
jgi:hypothetical protein